TPIPYKLVTIASGAAHFNLLVFTLASIATRGARFFLIAALLRRYGEPIRAFVEERLALITWVFLFAIIGGFLIAKYVV
ncbi:MAG TPA: DedA family protein, partial [Defluviicoccus sp.]|nr:DedA family protein [Defluviicoccus sp.]